MPADAEVVEFCRFLEPTKEEAAMREAATQRVREVILSIWPQASVQIFGSFVTGAPCLHVHTYAITCQLVPADCAIVCHYTGHDLFYMPVCRLSVFIAFVGGVLQKSPPCMVYVG